jgi:hypothetical protein
MNSKIFYKSSAYPMRNVLNIRIGLVSKLTGLVTILLASIPGLSNLARAEVAGFTGVTLDPSPTTDIVIPSALNTNTDPNFDITNTTLLKSFTTKFGTVDTLAGVTSVKNILTGNSVFGTGENESPDLDSIRNYWGFEGSELNGSDSLLGLDVSNGVDNAITLDAFFGATLADAGVPGLANDIFLTELFGDDSIRILPLDEKGNPIKDFELAINSGTGNFLFDNKGNFVPHINDIGNWGDTNTDLTLSIDFTSGNVFDDINLVGVAFDLSDFQGTGTLTGVAGLRIQGTYVNSGQGSIDLGIIGYNTAAVAVPEPASLVGIFGVALVLLIGHRSRGIGGNDRYRKSVQ